MRVVSSAKTARRVVGRGSTGTDARGASEALDAALLPSGAALVSAAFSFVGPVSPRGRGRAPLSPVQDTVRIKSSDEYLEVRLSYGFLFKKNQLPNAITYNA